MKNFWYIENSFKNTKPCTRFTYRVLLGGADSCCISSAGQASRILVSCYTIINLHKGRAVHSDLIKSTFCYQFAAWPGFIRYILGSLMTSINSNNLIIFYRPISHFNSVYFNLKLLWKGKHLLRRLYLPEPASSYYPGKIMLNVSPKIPFSDPNRLNGKLTN